MAACVSDIDEGTQARVSGTGSTSYRGRYFGPLTAQGSTIANIMDGSSNTILVIEDAGRSHPSTATFAARSSRSSPLNAPGHVVIGDNGVAIARRVYAWADPDAAGNGVSGPSNSTGSRIAQINNNKTPTGGPSTCSWQVNNCGPNDEPFSFHSGIAMSVMCDGSVRALKETIDAITLKAIVGASDGINVNID